MSEPSWLAGKRLISTRPPVFSLMRSIASRARLLTGCEGSWPVAYFSVNSAASPRREMIDPAKEIAAARDSVRAGLSSRSEELRKLGYDPDQVEADLAAENRRADALGLKFDSDGRFPMNAPMPGVADPAANADARADNAAK